MEREPEGLEGDVLGFAPKAVGVKAGESYQYG
jgi:hypothetical protein